MNRSWFASRAAWIPRCFCAWRMTCSGIVARRSSRSRPPWRKVSSGLRWTWPPAWACAARSSSRTSSRIPNSSPIPRNVATTASPNCSTSRPRWPNAWAAKRSCSEPTWMIWATTGPGCRRPRITVPITRCWRPGSTSKRSANCRKSLGFPPGTSRNSPACRRVSLTAPQSRPNACGRWMPLKMACAPWASGNCACVFTTKSRVWKSSRTPCRAPWSCARPWSKLGRKLGFTFVVLDLAGFASGSLNQLIGIRPRASASK